MSNQVQAQTQAQAQVQGEQGQISLSDFLLTQRRMMDQIITNYENNMVQFAQANEQLSKKVQELEAGRTEPQPPAGSDG